VSTLKNLSRGGYIVVGIVAALVLVPTGIAAAATVYNGIVGVSGYKGAMVMAVRIPRKDPIRPVGTFRLSKVLVKRSPPCCYRFRLPPAQDGTFGPCGRSMNR